MSEKALQRIAENKKTKDISLDLKYCDLSELPPQLQECIWLKELDLSDNVKLSNLSPLKDLQSLQILNIYSTKVAYLSPLKDLQSLKHLSVSATQVADLWYLKDLQSLQILNIYSTQVTDLSPLKNLRNLKELNVRNTQVVDLSPLKEMQNLQLLNAHSTQVADLSPLATLINLKELDVSQTQVTDLSPLAALVNLRRLNIYKTKVADLSPILPLIKKGIRAKWSSSYYSENQFILAGDCPLTNPPIEIVQQGNEAILNYFAQIEAQGGTEEILEAKMLIVGEGKTGKTTLFEKMKDRAFDPLVHPTDETHGINILEGLEIRHKSLGEQVFRANLWDFGGQELQYMTHQFFLTPRALFVLMMDARAEAPNLPYWFKIISLLGKDREDSPEKVPLLLVFNKRKDGTGKLPQYQDILKYYAEHLEPCFLEVDFAENDHRFENLIKTIEEHLVNLPIVRSKLPRQWKPIREALREESKKRPYISFERFGEICSEHKVTKEEDQLNLSGYLHQLGSLLHFQNDPSLLDLIVLSPQWAVEGVYCFLKNEKIAKQGGRFTPDDIFEILKKEDYSRTDAQKILKLMTKNNFDICYESSEGNYVAAQLLPDNAPPYIWHKKNGALQFRYQYPIMPKGLMSRLIVRLSDFIERDEKGVEMVWKKGAILRFNIEGEVCRVLMREDDAESQSGLRQIILEVMGEPRYRKFALRRVRDEVDELHRRWFRSIHADEMVPCCCESFCKNAGQPYLHKLDKLLNLKFNRNKPTAECGESGEDVRIQLMLEGVYDKSEISGFERESRQQ